MKSRSAPLLESRLAGTRAATRGSVLVMALLLIAVMGLLATSWIVLISSRSSMVEQMNVAMQRRVALENSKALAQEFMLERVLPSTSGAAFAYDLPARTDGGATDSGVSYGTWGGISVPAWGSAPMLSVQLGSGVNHFNPTNGFGDDTSGNPQANVRGYTLPLAITVKDGATANDGHLRNYEIKSRSPLLSGTLLVSQTPTLTASSVSIGGLTVGESTYGGGAFLWNVPISGSLIADSYASPVGVGAISVVNTAGSTVLMSNLAAPRQVANPRNGAPPIFYTGQIDAIDNPNLAANTQRNKTTGGITITGAAQDTNVAAGIACDGQGNLSITMGSSAIGAIYIPGGNPVALKTITLIGQTSPNDSTAGALPSLLIVIDPISNAAVPDIQCTLNNNRRFELAIKKTATSGTPTMQFVALSPRWRMLLDLENTPINITTLGVAVIQGGIRSDRSITLSGGNLNLQAETSGRFLEQLATRNAWVESYAP